MECRICKIDKSLDNFYKTTRHKSGYETRCKSCKNEYITKNITPKHREYYREYTKKWMKDNLDRKQEYEKQYWKSKYKKDINFTLRHLLRSHFYRLINKNNKNKNINDLIGCDIEQLKQHLESQFKPEMNWNNHKIIWEIDHIKPISLFNLTDIEQQKQCFHYTNLQPLFKTTEIAESLGYINETGNRNKNNKYLLT
jgi:hypothetical protein